MDFLKKLAGTEKPKRDIIKGELELYGEEPKEEISINDVIDLAIYRNNFHDELNNLPNTPDRLNQIENLAKRFGIPIDNTIQTMPTNSSIPTLEKKSTEKKYYDRMSFYSLMLVALRTDESQRKFVAMETNLFRCRISKVLNGVKGSFDIPKELKDVVNFNTSDYYNKNTNEYEIPFEEIFPFINVATCTCLNGFVHVNIKDLDGFLANLYTIYLNKMFGRIRKSKIHESALVKVVIRMFDDKTGNRQVKARTNYNRVTYDEIKTVVRSFPPCMRNMYDALMKNHKLFHQGRLHFGLFIKGIGLTMDESLKFWRTEMTKGISMDEFEKQYAYNIRHNYGKEGAGKNLSAYSCAGILRGPIPATGQTHGCPFKYMSQPQIEQLIKEINPEITTSKLNDIKEKAKANPGLACADVFNSIHPQHEMDETGTSHPNIYFNESEERYKEEQEKEKNQ